LLIFFIFGKSLPVKPNIEWQKSFGGSEFDDAFDKDQTTNGEYIVIGFTGSGNPGYIISHHGDPDFWVVGISESGALLPALLAINASFII